YLGATRKRMRQVTLIQHQDAHRSTRAGIIADRRPASEQSEPSPELELPDDPQRLETDLLRHLRRPDLAVHEDDRDLLDTESLAPRTVGRLDLEGVAVRADLLQSDRLERRSP